MREKERRQDEESEAARVAQAVMELEVNSDAVDTGVETVEVVAGGEEGGGTALMEQQLITTNTEELIVPTSEVGICSLHAAGVQYWGDGK